MEEKLKTQIVTIKVTKRRVGEAQPYEVATSEHEVNTTGLPSPAALGHRKKQEQK